MNKIEINSNGNFDVTPIVLPHNRLHALHEHLMLFFTGVSRTASDIAGDKIKAIPNKTEQMRAMRLMVDEAIQILTHGNDITDFGRLLHESWMLKRQISNNISPSFIDEIYARARAAGAVGGKLLGAGGGGFMLFFVSPELKPQVCEALKDLLLVPFELESSGSQIIFYDNMNYSQMSMNRRDYRHLQPDSDSENTTVKQRLTRLLQVKNITETI